MKEIKKKIKDSIFGDFNQELIGDKVTLQNKVNKLQRMIDMINYLQPIEKEDFVLPEKWCVRINSIYKQELYDYARSKDDFDDSLGFEGYLINTNEDNTYQHWGKPQKEGYTEITFEQFKKYVLNK